MARDNRKEMYREMETAFGRVPQWLDQMPDAAATAFWTLMRDFQLKDTKIPAKYKELIGIAVSGATRCRYCALFHTEAAKLHGATNEEIAEASAMGALTMFGSTFLNAQQVDYEDFRQETLDIVTYVKQQQAKGALPPQGREQVTNARA
jgi:AhpD family alkylhydroperoxidase